MGTGQFSTFVAPVTGRTSMVVLNLDFDTFGTRFGAAFHDAWGHVNIIHGQPVVL